MGPDEHKQILVAEVENTAEWRGRKAEEYPEDDRNERGSSALSTLAANIDALPSDHRLLQRLAEINQSVGDLLDRMKRFGRESFSVDGVYARISEEQSDLLNRYGFDDPSEDGSDVEAFLSVLCDMTQECIDEAMVDDLGVSVDGGGSVH